MNTGRIHRVAQDPQEPRFAVVLLNWHGAEDTLACLDSLRASEPLALPVVVDNGSSDDSVLRLRASFTQAGVRWHEISPEGLAGSSKAWQAVEAVLLLSPENLGFARGCNLGLRAAQAIGVDITIFLNNDTVVEPGALSRLVTRLREDSEITATLPLIGIFGTDRTWNAGGRVWRVGLRRYHFAGAPLAHARHAGELECSFMTGCCFAVRTAQMMARGGFSERFFFGEEDFELGLWMRDHGLRAVCLTDALVWHKVGASINRASGPHAERRAFAHYLNRFVHMRLRFGRPLWDAWAVLYLPYILLLLWRAGLVRPMGWGGFVSALWRLSTRLDGVDRATFEALMSGRRDQLAAGVGEGGL